ncbi:MAG TPA: hypothetical protein VFA12_20515 [Stellaceae bacterium]|nr:hypothetical protein [Stellaceae bacterium]
MPFDGIDSELRYLADAVEVLREARAKLAEGWCQNYACIKLRRWQLLPFPRRMTSYRYCLVGAVLAIKSVQPREGFALWRFLQATGITVPPGEIPTPYLTAWNDQPGRTQAEVVDLCDKAIALAEEALRQQTGIAG